MALAGSHADFREDRLRARTLIQWVMKAEVDSGKRAGIPTDMAGKREPRQGEEGRSSVRGTVFPTNEILRKASA